MSRPYEWREAPAADFAVLGDPISHSLSPRLHQAAYEALGLCYRYVAIRVIREELNEALDRLSSLNCRGVNLTVPLKEAGAAWSLNPDAFVRRVGSTNTLNLQDGSCTNTDAPGFMDTLPAIGVWPPTPVLLLGAGGSARALATALSDAGHKLRIFNRTTERAKRMVEDLAIQAEVIKEPNPEGVGLVLNTTSAAFEGETVPVQWHRADKRAIAYDIAYGGELSPFILQAGLAGLKVVDGLEMLVAQAARSFEWWLGTAAPLDAMRKAIG